MIRIVVDQDEIPRLREVGELNGVTDAAVAPADSQAIFLVGVLPVVKEEVDVARKDIAR